MPVRTVCALAVALFFPSVPQTAPVVATHDNLRPAGRLANGELQLSLWAGLGRWYPEGPAARARLVPALGEEGGPLSIPSPLIRVPAGTAVRATIRNSLPTDLRITGLCDRPGKCETQSIPAGGTRDLRFTLTAPGAFSYFGLTLAASFGERSGIDSQLGGALIVDPPGRASADRVLVMGLMTEDGRTAQEELTVINGRTWPLTERLHYTTGDEVRWRVLNLTNSPHAMHLHGFYYTVESEGDGVRDRMLPEAERRLSVTEQTPPGRVITLKWIPERAGNWLFHCHMLIHMMPPEDHAGHQAPAAAGMSGLVVGVQVTGPDRVAPETSGARRELRLTIDPDTRHGATPSFKVTLQDGSRPIVRVNDRPVPGPALVLTRGEPVSVEVMNRLEEPTAIHWHGIELESYSDGVPGFGGTSNNITPPVAAGGSFTARFTPSRAGTFIYHTHWHNSAQLAAGIYGAIVVLEPGQKYDPSVDHLVVIGLDGPNRPLPDEPVVINGESKPRPLVLKAGVPNRLRFINITPDNVAFTVQLLSRFDPHSWTTVGKDGASLPTTGRKAQPARQLISVGETYDFEVAPLPANTPNLWMELRRGNGELMVQWGVRVR
jgi:FtsP/CotA-like multicopper oxidase with cupredoxin domain